MILRTATASVLLLSLIGCTSTHMGTVGFDARGRPVPIPGLGIGGDVVGDVSLRISGHGAAVINVKAPPMMTDFPIMRVAVLNRKGTEILGYNEVPIVPGIYHGQVNNGLWAGFSRFARSISNLAGTVLSGWMGIEAVRAGVGNTLVPTQ